MFLHAQTLSMKQVAQKTRSHEVVMLYLNTSLFTELKVYFYMKQAVVFFNLTLTQCMFINLCFCTHNRTQCKKVKAVSALLYAPHVRTVTLWGVHS